jgi:hypothetical protein
MTDLPKPTAIAGATGLVWRARNRGWVATWQCRADIAKRGFKPTTVPIWRGAEPSEPDRRNIIAQCELMQAEMLRFANDVKVEVVTFDCTIRSLIECYRTDPDSPFRKNRYQTRKHYESLCRRIDKDMGDKTIEEIDARAMLRAYEGWSEGGKIPMAHSLVGMFRSLITFGATLLKDKNCRALKGDLSDMRFKMGQARGERLTAEQAAAICAKAHDMGLHSLALAQAIQFECMLRQRDVIGEWVPMSEPGISDVTHDGQKWLRGITWAEIDANLILRHVTSKRQKMVEHDLGVAEMVQAEFARIGTLPTSGPVVVYEITERPYSAHQFRALWRDVARAAGVPDAVRNMDSRAGAITEATEAGAELEHIKHAAAHSDIAMTQKYARAPAEKTRGVAVKRAEHRKNKSGT